MWSIYPYQNRSLFFLHKIQIQGFDTKTKSILEFLNDDPAMRQIFLQKRLDNDNSDDKSNSVESATGPRIKDLQDSQGPYDLRQKQNFKNQMKRARKGLDFSKSKGHYN